MCMFEGSEREGMFSSELLITQSLAYSAVKKANFS
jgi:hypothetical protein